MRTNSYGANLRRDMFRLLSQGLTVSAAARELGVPRSTAQRVAEEYRLAHGQYRRGPGRTTHGYELNARRDAELRRDQERERYAHHYDDLNVIVFGDPPLHRSALGAKLHGQG